MQKLIVFIAVTFFGCVLLSALNVRAQDSIIRRLEITNQLQRPPQHIDSKRSSRLKGLQLFAENSGIVFTDDTLFRSDDNGLTWRELSFPRTLHEKIATASFRDENRGFVILAAVGAGKFAIGATSDGGQSWSRHTIAVRQNDAQQAQFDDAALALENDGTMTLSIKLQSSSNFDRKAVYRSEDGGRNWFLKSEIMSAGEVTESRANQNQFSAQLKKDETIAASSAIASTSWILVRSGSCEGLKSDCTQESRLVRASGNPSEESADITPPVIKELNETQKKQAKLAAKKSVFALPPNGNTRISLNRGFDKCTAATVSQMQAWWANSPFYDVNIYMSGRNRGCTQAQLNAAWVNSVTAQGWGLIPTIVGYQSPCSVCTSCQKHSSDPVTAEQQGRGEADIAVTDASNLGLTTGSILYYDMERYDDLSGTGACSTPTKAFLKGWTDRVKELGYKSGVYGSPFNANGDWINIAPASQPDVVWLARWNNIMSVWGVAPLPDTFWTNHQRIHQWLGPRDETWGGVLFNIDNNISDAPVAANAFAKNKRADFDGDGKSDISVWRPSTGTWYAANSSNGSFAILNFGLSTDIMAPGDYDGDGKTDFAVWRPTNGVWHLYSRSIYRSSAFGSPGDIPVQADYDGDGRTDMAVFRPSTGVWYIWNSFDSRGTSYSIVQFGLNGDRPVQGDYDGDGKTDIAVFRPSNGVWYLLQSTAGFAATQFGISTDTTVPADYDGDGKTDLGIYRDGVWYLFQSQAGVYVTQFGLPNDIPSVGDFDGDGKSDVSVFRPDSGVWYLWQSQAGIVIAQFGLTGDKPVPAAYTP